MQPFLPPQISLCVDKHIHAFMDIPGFHQLDPITCHLKKRLINKATFQGFYELDPMPYYIL